MRMILCAVVFLIIEAGMLNPALSVEQPPELKEYFSTVEGLKCQQCLFDYRTLILAGKDCIGKRKYCVALEYLQEARRKMLECELLCPIYIRDRISRGKSWVELKDKLERLIELVDRECRGR